MTEYTVIATYRNGEEFVKIFNDANSVLYFAQSEVHYENTVRVDCDALDIHLSGDFNCFFNE